MGGEQISKKKAKKDEHFGKKKSTRTKENKGLKKKITYEKEIQKKKMPTPPYIFLTSSCFFSPKSYPALPLLFTPSEPIDHRTDSHRISLRVVDSRFVLPDLSSQFISG